MAKAEIQKPAVEAPKKKEPRKAKPKNTAAEVLNAVYGYGKNAAVKQAGRLKNPDALPEAYAKTMAALTDLRKAVRSKQASREQIQPLRKAFAEANERLYQLCRDFKPEEPAKG